MVVTISKSSRVARLKAAREKVDELLSEKLAYRVASLRTNLRDDKLVVYMGGLLNKLRAAHMGVDYQDYSFVMAIEDRYVTFCRTGETRRCYVVTRNNPFYSGLARKVTEILNESVL